MFGEAWKGGVGKFPGISAGLGRSLSAKNDIVTRQLKMFGHGVHGMNCMITLDSSVEYLRMTNNIKSIIVALAPSSIRNPTASIRIHVCSTM